MNFDQGVELVANVFFLSFVVGIPVYALCHKVKVFDVFVEGGREGFQVALKIIPYLVAILVAIGMFRASGALEMIGRLGAPLWNALGLPAELLPLALVRPFSGTAATGIMAELIHQQGGNAYISQLAATIMGSTETTFYVVAVYFGAVGIRRTRQAIPAGLVADVVGVLASIWICSALFL